MRILRISRLALSCVAAALLAPSLGAQAQTWEYKAYKKARTGQYDKTQFIVGEIGVEEKDGKASFHMIAGGVDACLRGDIPALVTKTAETTTIELQQSLAGCEPVRYVIRNDGSGGDREVKRNDAWVKDGWDHGLTPKEVAAFARSFDRRWGSGRHTSRSC